MTRITTMLGMAAGAAIAFTAPASAGGIQYLNQDCEPDTSPCPIVTEPTSISTLRERNGLTLAQFRASNPGLPAGVGDDYVVGADGFVMFWPLARETQTAGSNPNSYIQRVADRIISERD